MGRGTVCSRTVPVATTSTPSYRVFETNIGGMNHHQLPVFKYLYRVETAVKVMLPVQQKYEYPGKV